MPDKKILFRDRPTGNSYGQYTFLENNSYSEYVNSDSVPVEWDKFIDKDLYTLSKDHAVNQNIVESMIEHPDGSNNDYLKYNQDTFIKFNELVLTRRPGITYGIKDVDTKIYMFSAYAEAFDTMIGDFNDTPYRSPYKYDDGGQVTTELKTWAQYRADLWRTEGDAVPTEMFPYDENNNRDVGEIAILLNKRLSGVSQAGEGTGDVPQFDNYVAITNLTNQSPDYPTWNDIEAGGNFYTTQDDAAENHHNISVAAGGHLSAFMVKPPIEEGEGEGEESGPRNQITQIFQEDGQYNPIYIVVQHRGDASVPGGGNDYTRNDRIQTFKINPNDLFNFDSEGNVTGKQTSFEFTESDSLIMDEDNYYQADVAQTVTSLKITINTLGYGDGYSVVEKYEQYLTDITAPQIPLDLENMDERFLNIKPTNEIFFTSRTNIAFPADIDVINEFTDWIPISKITLIDSHHDLQVFYSNESDRLKSSAPLTIGLDFGVAGQTPNESELIDRASSLPENLNIGYAYYVISWDDVDNKYDNWENVIANHPESFNKLLVKQQDNLYKFGVAGRKPLKHGYASAGIKKIKIVMFNYQINNNNPNLAEPIRWKLVTVRHFLDIPRNEYPEFGELGGDDYVTIPWPHTSPVIGGISKKSQYFTSIEKTLSGGKITELDIIDESFL